MIPNEWTPVRRDTGREIVGYLAPDGASTLVVPMTVLGTPFGPADSVVKATAALRDTGPGAVAERWWCQLPKTLPESPIDATIVEIGWAWRPVLIISVGPERCSVRPAFAYPDEFSRCAHVAIPVGDRLRALQPGA